jgi:hypothetical protein
MRGDVETLVKEHNKHGFLRYIERAKPLGEAKTSAGALNFGIGLVLDADCQILSARESSSIESLCYLHSDDLLPMRSVEHRIRKIKSRGFSYGLQLIFSGADHTILTRSGRPDIFHTKSQFPHHTAMFALDLARKARIFAKERLGQDGIFNIDLPCCEDWDAMLTLAACAKKIHGVGSFVKEYVYYYRKHLDNISGETNGEVANSATRAIALRHNVKQSYFFLERLTYDFPWSLCMWLPEHIKSKFRIFRDGIKRSLLKSKASLAIPADILEELFLSSIDKN